MTTPTREQVIERSRIDFECYFLDSRKSKSAGRAPTFLRYEHDGTYIDDHTQRHWWTWQQAVNAGRDQGLREAKGVCEAERVEDTGAEGDVAYNMAIGHCAAAIEQLRTKQ